MHLAMWMLMPKHYPFLQPHSKCAIGRQSYCWDHWFPHNLGCSASAQRLVLVGKTCDVILVVGRDVKLGLISLDFVGCIRDQGFKHASVWNRIQCNRVLEENSLKSRDMLYDNYITYAATVVYSYNC
jgi:hypothetical protein